jgi:predicted nucleic acid-binding protein
MRGKAFLDTNVLIYAFAKDDPRAEAAEELLSRGSVIGVQNLNEFVAVAGRKLAMPLPEILRALHAIRSLCPQPVPVTVKAHDTALQIVGTYGYHIYDALVIAVALEASCTTLYSEDMRAGQAIGDLTIRNPFRKLMTV